MTTVTNATANEMTRIADELSQRLTGRVVTASHSDYDAMRRLVADVDTLPPVIARVTDTQDVVSAVNYARENGLEIAVRGGGHGAAGLATTATGIVIDMRDMRGIEIDPIARIAWAQAGLTAADVVRAAGEHDLVIGFGDTGSVGIGGITLGGGIGFLSRRYGMTIDSLLHVELVTADGEVLQVDPRRNPDLFWALRGGGGNFGVATAFCYELQRLPKIVGGMLLLPATPETIAGFVALSEAAPDELTTIANVMNCPPMPLVPEEWHDRPVIMGLLCYAGPAAAAEPVLAPFRKLGEPIADMVKPMPYADMFPAEEADPEYHPTAVARNMFIERFTEDEARDLLDRIQASDSPMRGAQLRVHGGAIARVPADATAFAHRQASIMVNLFCFYTGADDLPQREAWIRDLVAHLDQGVDGAYVNFVGDEGPDRLQAAYPETTLRRLREVKQRYDSSNLFHRNHNVAPVA